MNFLEMQKTKIDDIKNINTSFLIGIDWPKDNTYVFQTKLNQ